ncbi:hypothetical protein [Oceanobacillus manasiensis]|uniref:hypothetical protein n=1 Tax=Oceanobacillus manasiensis TaxID=586413 RepID=UPI0005A7F790|nr:hypothetical protein [Oceanobacillus manasiensis]
MEKAQIITEEDIKRYDILNKQKKELEQEMNRLKKKFHTYLDEELGEDKAGDVTRGHFNLKRQIRSSTAYDPELTIKMLEDASLQDFVLIEKKPDTEKLEAAIKLGLVEKEPFEKCKKVKSTQAIVVKEV